MRDRTFFFGSFEALREARPQTDSVRMPTIDARHGILPGEDPIEIHPACCALSGVVPGSRAGQLRSSEISETGRCRARWHDHAEDTKEDYISTKMDHQFAERENRLRDGNLELCAKRPDSLRVARRHQRGQ